MIPTRRKKTRKINTIIIVLLCVLTISIYFISSSNSSNSDDQEANLPQENDSVQDESSNEEVQADPEVLSAVDEQKETKPPQEETTKQAEPTPTPTVTPTPEEPMDILDAGNSMKAVNLNFGFAPDTYENKSAFFYFVKNTSRSDIGNYILEELLKGPTKEQEQEFKVFTPFALQGESNCDGEDFTITQEKNTVEVKFCKKLNFINKADDVITRNIINANYKQFESVDKVIIYRSDGSEL